MRVNDFEPWYKVSEEDDQKVPGPVDGGGYYLLQDRLFNGQPLYKNENSCYRASSSLRSQSTHDGDCYWMFFCRRGECGYSNYQFSCEDLGGGLGTSTTGPDDTDRRQNNADLFQGWIIGQKLFSEHNVCGQKISAWGVKGSRLLRLHVKDNEIPNNVLESTLNTGAGQNHYKTDDDGISWNTVAQLQYNNRQLLGFHAKRHSEEASEAKVRNSWLASFKLANYNRTSSITLQILVL